MTYKIGTRAGLGAVKDKSLPWLDSEAPSIEVAAGFTCIYRILMWKLGRKPKTVSFCRYQSVSRKRHLARVWQGNALQILKKILLFQSQSYAT